MTTYLDKTLASKVSPPQSQPLDSDQVRNSAGGYSYEVDDFMKLRRFLILGTEGGSYYAGETKLTLENVDAVERCIKGDGLATVAEIVAVSKAGRAPKNDQAILALALCIAKGDQITKAFALENVDKVARTGTHLFQLVEFLNKLGSLSGRAKRRALARWYTDKTPDQVAYQAVKYRQRNGWTHRDVLRVAHPGSVEPVDAEHARLFQYIAGKARNTLELPAIVNGYERAQIAQTPAETAALVREYNLPREALKTEHLTSPEVWQAMLDVGMPMTAMIRNLGNMTRIGLLTPTSDATQIVLNQLRSGDAIRKARVHPLNILFALDTYQSGQGFKGTNTWTPVTKIVGALDRAFYKAFGNVEPTGKRYMLALDVSGSMGGSWGDRRYAGYYSYGVGGTNISPRAASAAMALVTESIEDRVEIYGFATSFMHLGIHSAMSLQEACRVTDGLPFGGTDCSLPMQYAQRKRMEIDTFVVYTDSETWAGSVHPAQALKNYRKSMGIDAKLVVVGMVSNGFSIADPKDRGMLDVVGFDTATPQIISDFASGLI